MGSPLSTTTLGELIDQNIIKTLGGFPFGGHNSDGDGVPHLRPFNITTSGDVSLEQIKSIPSAAAEGKPKTIRNDILFNNTNTKELVGKCALWNSDAAHVFSNHMTVIRADGQHYSAAFLSFAILYHWIVGKSEMLARSHVAQASIIGHRFREIEIPALSLWIQASVGEILGQVRRASGFEAESLRVARALKKTVVTSLFTHGLRGEVQKETEIGWVPKSWDVVRLGELGRVGNGSTPKRTIPAYWSDGTYPWLTSAKVYDRDITSADQFVTATALAECHLPKVQPGALLMAITGQGKTLGHCAVLRVEATISQHVAYVQTDLTRANPGFVRGYLETLYDYLRQVGAGGGSTKGALTCAFLRSLPVPLPSLPEQDEIVEVLDAIDRKIELHQQKRAVLEELFKALLHKLMTGEIDVNDLDLQALSAHEPAIEGSPA